VRDGTAAPLYAGRLQVRNIACRIPPAPVLLRFALRDASGTLFPYSFPCSSGGFAASAANLQQTDAEPLDFRRFRGGEQQMNRKRRPRHSLRSIAFGYLIRPQCGEFRGGFVPAKQFLSGLCGAGFWVRALRSPPE
jgi:hypothetical protein